MGRTGWACMAYGIGIVLGPGGPATAAEPAETCPPAEARTEDGATSSTFLAPLPGKLVSYAVPRSADGSRRVVMLLRPHEGKAELTIGRALNLEDLRLEGRNIEIDRKGAGGDWKEIVASLRAGKRPLTPCEVSSELEGPALFTLEPGAPPTLVRPVSAEARALLALDLDGDGDDEVLLEEDDALVQLPEGEDGIAAGVPQPLFVDPDLRLGVEEPRDVRFPTEPVVLRSPFDDSHEVRPRGHASPATHVQLAGGPGPAHVRVTGFGALKLYAPDGGTGAWGAVSRVGLPSRSRADANQLLLASPQVRSLGTTADGATLLAAGPVPYGGQRLKTVLISVGDPAAPEVWERWSRLPGEHEEVSRSGYLLLDDEPFLWVVTEEEKGIQIFGDKDRFRLFRLAVDRTRAGADPVLRLEEAPGLRGLQAAHDVNGDGRGDLVLITGGEKVTLSWYLQRKDGTFSRSPSRQELEPGGWPASFGRDLDGDGRGDLLVAGGDRLRVHGFAPGAGGGRRIVEKVPRWSALAPETDSPERVRCSSSRSVHDLDGDGRAEWLCVGADGYGRPHFRVVRFTRPAP